MRALLLSAYAAGSHQRWREAVEYMLADWQWQVLEMPGRHFAWRVRGNPLHWALQERACLAEPYDVVLATSMVDLATLRGLVPELARRPAVLYFHENQFAYPSSSRQASLLEAQMVSIYSAMAADRLLFNSAFNRDSFLDGVSQLMGRLPDFAPRDLAELLQARASVLPVPFEIAAAPARGRWPGRPHESRERPLRLLWLGRFEHDKDSGQLAAILRLLEARDLDYELALNGQRFRDVPQQLMDVERDFRHRLVHSGFLDRRDDYLSLLRGADIVLSTAQHEFQGIAVMEAVACGCVPVLPDRLAYREYYPGEFRYHSAPHDQHLEAQAAAALIETIWTDFSGYRDRLPDMSAYSPQHLASAYRRVLEGATG